MQTFICHTCGKELPITEFTKNKSKKNGINTSCKKCTSIYKAKYRAEHEEEISIAKKKCYEAKKEQYLDRIKENYQKNKWTSIIHYCTENEKIENYELAKADNFIGWDRHHRLETHNSDGERRLVPLSVAELKALDMYYNRPPEELIWLRHDEHKKLHWGKND